MSKPTNFSTEESLEVIWDVIHEWEAMRLIVSSMVAPFVLERFSSPRPEPDDAKTAMAWITEALRDSEIIKLRKMAKELMVQIKEDVPRESVTSHWWDAFDELTELGEKLFHKN